MKKIKNVIQSISYGNKSVACLRIIMGIIFVYSGIFKVIDPVAFGRVLSQYKLIPEIIIPYFAVLLSFFELSLGVLLIAGYRIKAVSFLSIITMSFFTLAITINVIRGENFDCGCFELSRFGINEEISFKLIIRDVIFVFIFYIIFKVKKHYYSIDNFIEKEELTNI